MAPTDVGSTVCYNRLAWFDGTNPAYRTIGCIWCSIRIGAASGFAFLHALETQIIYRTTGASRLQFFLENLERLICNWALSALKDGMATNNMHTFPQITSDLIIGSPIVPADRATASIMMQHRLAAVETGQSIADKLPVFRRNVQLPTIADKLRVFRRNVQLPTSLK